jgi:hypothetical protein
MSTTTVQAIEAIPKVQKQIKEKKVYDLKVWMKNPQTNRMMKIDGKTHKEFLAGESKPTKEKVVKDDSNSVVNPATNKRILIGGRAHKKMMGEETVVVKPGFIKNPKQGGRWIKIGGKTYLKLEAEGFDLKEPETENSVIVN